MNAHIKLGKLFQILKLLERAVVAFSGGVDSVFLAAAAYKVLGENAIAVTAKSESFTAGEQADAERAARLLGISHYIIPTDEFKDPEFLKNSPERCYYCKRIRFGALTEWAKARGFGWVMDGTNADDCNDYRPGMRALAENKSVISPLMEAGLTKEDIRLLSKEWGLFTWDKPSVACLISRLDYGIEITADRLKQVAQAEEIVRRYCSGQIRVRHHGSLARVEVDPSDIPRMTEAGVRYEVCHALKALGFTFIALDLAGYRTGSMNETLNEVRKNEA